MRRDRAAAADLHAFFDHHLPTFRGRPLLAGTRRVDAVFEVRVTDVPGFRRTVEIRDGELRRVVSGEMGDQVPLRDVRRRAPADPLRRARSRCRSNQ